LQDGQVIVAHSWYDADTGPDWRRRPAPEDLRLVWPTEALSHRRGGRATIDCIVALTGNLYGCVVLAESPPGQGFGLAAIALTPQFLMRPATRGGVPVPVEIDIPINFDANGMGPGDASMGRTALPPAALSWIAAPSLQDMAAAYPARARAASLRGFASLQCIVFKDGRLGKCDLMREEPRDQGFATAAKTLVRQFQVDPALLKELSVQRASVSLPFTFDPKVFDGTSGGTAQWTHTPDAADLRAAFTNLKPHAPSGLAVLSCHVLAGGRLDACTVASETPAGAGLGQTALALRDTFRLATWSDEGLPIVGETVHVPIRFNFEAPPPPATPPNPPPKP
jgi:TonB family protein